MLQLTSDNIFVQILVLCTAFWLLSTSSYIPRHFASSIQGKALAIVIIYIVAIIISPIVSAIFAIVFVVLISDISEGMSNNSDTNNSAKTSDKFRKKHCKKKGIKTNFVDSNGNVVSID